MVVIVAVVAVDVVVVVGAVVVVVGVLVVFAHLMQLASPGKPHNSQTCKSITPAGMLSSPNMS